MLVRRRLFKVRAEPVERGFRKRRTECTVEQIVGGAVPQLDEGLVEAIGAARVLQEEMCVLKEILVERTVRERQSNLGKIFGELAEEHITQKQLENAHAADLERDRFEAAQMRDDASSEYHVVSEVGSAADVEHGFLGVKEVRDILSTVHARSPGIAKHSAVTAVGTTVAKTEARPLGTVKYMATAKSILAEIFGELHEEAGPSWSRASGTSSVVGSTVAKPVDEARPPLSTVYSASEDTDVPEALRQVHAVMGNQKRTPTTLATKVRQVKQPENGGRLVPPRQILEL